LIKNSGFLLKDTGHYLFKEREKFWKRRKMEITTTIS